MKRFCGFITGFVFFISGILKLMDPVGTGLIIKEYLEFLHITFLNVASKQAGVAFALAEVILGTGLITGVWRKAVAFATICFQSFFTVLTLLLVTFKPEMDCGCFGEALHLSHEQTFTKNLIILALLLIYYIPARHLGQTKSRKYVSFGIVTASVIAFTIFSCIHIPLNDYTDYHSGVSLKGELASNSYQAVFRYEKDGIQKTFNIDNLPDSTWTFVSTETINTGDDATAAALSFHDLNGIDADSLALKGKVFIISIYDTDIREKDRQQILSFAERAEQAGFKSIVLSSSAIDFPDNTNSFIADYKTLITFNRSNGGATYINDGLIISKWSKKSLPDTKELAKIYNEDVTETIIGNSRSSLAFQGFLLYVFAVMLLL